MPPPSDQRPGIWQLAFPSILGNLTYSLVGLVQIRFLGALGTEALAAVGVGQRVFFAMQAVMFAVSAGTTALVARAWGARDGLEASRVTMASLVLGGLLSLLIMLIGLFGAEAIAALFGLDPVTLELAAANIRMFSYFNLAFAVTFVLSAALRAAGDAWSPLWIGLGMNLLNLPLLYALIFGRWGFPALGVVGAPAAAGIAFSMGAGLLLALWLAQKFRVRHVAGGWWRRKRLRRLLDVGYPAALEQMVFQVGFFIFLALIGNFYGTDAFAAYNVGATMLMICVVVGFGFSIAGSTLVGQHLGAKDPDAAARSGWRACRLAAVSMGALGLLIMIFARPIAQLFVGDDSPALAHTIAFSRILGLAMPLMAIEFALGGALRGAGDTRFPLLTTCLGLLVMRCGLAAVFTWLELPVIWVYGALMGDYLLKGVLLVARFKRGRWKTVIPAF